MIYPFIFSGNCKIDCDNRGNMINQITFRYKTFCFFHCRNTRESGRRVFCIACNVLPF